MQKVWLQNRIILPILMPPSFVRLRNRGHDRQAPHWQMDSHVTLVTCFYLWEGPSVVSPLQLCSGEMIGPTVSVFPGLRSFLERGTSVLKAGPSRANRGVGHLGVRVASCVFTPKLGQHFTVLWLKLWVQESGRGIRPPYLCADFPSGPSSFCVIKQQSLVSICLTNWTQGW